ncbi:hypothetical protein L1S34_14090 [Flavobacterium sp. K77]|uniref:phosphoribosyltransferase-like protein n=1 Tax=Flavobacterium sp. K77 TaxID=2910676 RepID=UPI001F36FAAC|nr:hypothetical protein [Flavobacterium sp. K77]MCF6142422.1 hypothetical protein [Flavobacterium sp. K77]
MMELPKDWKIYSNAIRDRCRDLIQYKIWSGIELVQFNKWRNNFKTDEEKYFSACVLDSLIYRSNQQTYSLIEDMLFKNLNNLFRTLGYTEIIDFPNNMTTHIKDPLIRFVPVITRFDPVTKSSNEILRFMKRYFYISEQWIINPWNIEEEVKKGVKIFIFIDDFLGTGQQFDDAITYSNLGQLIKNNTFIYATLLAHENGIKFLEIEHPLVQIVQSEKLSNSSHSFFYNYFPKNEMEAKNFYVEMIQKRGITLSSGNEYGFGNLELTVAFEHAAPDNSLQILTYRTENWNPLFNR